MAVKQAPATPLKLSANFYLSEMTVSDTAARLGIDNTPGQHELQNLFKLAALLEQVRKALGNKPILVTSGYRGIELNRRIGGSTTSEHVLGLAADFTCPAFGTVRQTCKAIVAAGIPFGQLIDEFGRWVHISVPDGQRDGQVFTARRIDGKTIYTPGLV